METHPPHGGVSDQAPPEERLRGVVVAILSRINDESLREFLIVLRELINPTGLLDEVLETELVPLHRLIEGIIGELLGPGASVMQVRFCVVSVLNQCIIPLLAKHAHRRCRHHEEGIPGKVDDVEAYIDHVVRFSLGGIRAVQE